MKLKSPIFVLIIIGIGCKSNTETAQEDRLTTKNKPTTIKRIYVGAGGHEVEEYYHYLIIDPYVEDMDNFFMEFADRYRDTCKTGLPIGDIIFCKPFEFKEHEPSIDDEVLKKHSIVSISYTEETLTRRYPDISSITFYENGHPIYVQTMTLDRMKNAGYFDSTGAYKRAWIKEFDSTF